MAHRNSKPLALRSGRVEAPRSARNTAGEGLTTRSGLIMGTNRSGSNRARPGRAGPSAETPPSHRDRNPEAQGQARQNSVAGPANPQAQNANRNEGAAQGLQAPSDSHLIQKVCLDSVTAAEKEYFQDKNGLDASFQLLAYRQLDRLCEDGTAEARNRAVRLDLALHPILQPHLFADREHLAHGFLKGDRDEKVNAAMRGQYAATETRRIVASSLSFALIDRVVASTASADDKELFRLKWRFGDFVDHIDRRMQVYEAGGHQQKQRCLSEARAQEEIDLLVDRMKKGMDHHGNADSIPDGSGLAFLVTKVRSGTATAPERQSCILRMREDWCSLDTVQNLASLHEQRSTPHDEDYFDRLGGLWAVAEEDLVERVAQRTATAREAQTFQEALNEGGIGEVVYEKDREYRALRSIQGMMNAAELRVVLQKSGFRAHFHADNGLRPYERAAIQYHSQPVARNLWDWA